MELPAEMTTEELQKKQKWLQARPCCRSAKQVRDKCIKFNGESNCVQFIEAHQQCLRVRRSMQPPASIQPQQ